MFYIIHLIVKQLINILGLLYRRNIDFEYQRPYNAFLYYPTKLWLYSETVMGTRQRITRSLYRGSYAEVGSSFQGNFVQGGFPANKSIYFNTFSTLF